VKQKILIIDDEPDLLTYLKTFLEDQGYEVCCAGDVQSALKMVPSEKPDLVCLDIMMPIMNGYEVCAQLRLQDKMKDVPIILLSSAYTTDTVRQGKIAGGSGYVAKPFTPGELVTEIKKLLPQNV